MWWRVKWIVLWSLWAGRVVRQPTPPVRTSGGWLRGSIAHSGTHAHYLSIPYATLQGRFQAPGPEPTWHGVFDAIEEYIHCKQALYLRANRTSGTTNCLILNVYTPLNIPPEKPLPVMVFIHGGGFFQRSATRMIYGPEYVTSKGVVLVTLNYRLNIQGYLCLGIKEAPGNAGMKDQVAALKWVQKNIKAFGGDPDNVTIFGESAGGASVSLHVLSPMSKGLFHKAIAQSGSSLSAFAIQYDPVESARLLANTMDFDSKDPHKLYNFLMKKNDDDLIINRVPRRKGTTALAELLSTPCVEKILEGEEPFLTDLPYNLLTEGKYNKVPMIIGANVEEGLYLMTLDLEDLIMAVTFEDAFPNDLVFPSNETRKEVANELKKLYMGTDSISKQTKGKLSKLYGEPYLNYAAAEETELLLKTTDQPIYHYLFAYEGGRNILKKRLSKELKSVPGASHADELFYLFSQVWIPSLFETEMINQMTTMWTNFAKYGDPTPPEMSGNLPLRWPPVTAEDKRILVVDHQLTTTTLWHSPSVNVWRELYSKYRRKLPAILDQTNNEVLQGAARR